MTKKNQLVKKQSYEKISSIMEWATEWKKQHPEIQVPLSELNFWRYMYKRHRKITKYGRWYRPLE